MTTNKTASPPMTFAVDSVTVGQELLPTEKAHVSIEKLLETPLEACDTYHVDVVKQPGFHSLIAAAHLAYQYHFFLSFFLLMFSGSPWPRDSPITSTTMPRKCDLGLYPMKGNK